MSTVNTDSICYKLQTSLLQVSLPETTTQFLASLEFIPYEKLLLKNFPVYNSTSPQDT